MSKNILSDNKDPYRRGINRAEGDGLANKVFQVLDRGVKEKKGRCEEVKILETHNKFRVKKELLLIRRFLRMKLDKTINIADQREHRD